MQHDTAVHESDKKQATVGDRGGKVMFIAQSETNKCFHYCWFMYCIYSSFLQRSFEINFKLDPCQDRLSIGIENIQYNRTLTDFTWGKFLLFILFNLLYS
jgi:hypothetical protein